MTDRHTWIFYFILSITLLIYALKSNLSSKFMKLK